jgi:hypothetical protein
VINQGGEKNNTKQEEKALPEKEPAKEKEYEEQPALEPTTTPSPCTKPDFQNETILDNTVFEPGDIFMKTWTIRK